MRVAVFNPAHGNAQAPDADGEEAEAWRGQGSETRETRRSSWFQAADGGNRRCTLMADEIPA